MERVSCLGPEGSYSELAAKKLREDHEVVLCNSFREAVNKLLSGETEYAVLPVENALNGGVQESLDLLAAEDIFGYEEYLLVVDHRLAMLEGVKPEDIRYIYSHEQAIGQCSEYLAKYFPDATCLPTSSTASSLTMLDRESAGIVGAHLQREGVVLTEENIADNKGNYTRFLLIGRRGEVPEHSVMVFFSAVCAHKPGSLVNLLKIFQRYSLNLTRIESRPVKQQFGQYRFFIEVAGDIGTERVKQALIEAQKCCVQFKLLGAYN